MMLFFSVVIGVVIIQRMIELYVAKRNANILRAKGGYEVGAKHYKYFIILHSMFLLSLILEVVLFKHRLPLWWPISFSIFLLAQILRVWCIKSLGFFWNTRIIVLPHAKIIQKGPYKYIRHPNYVVVVAELIFLPLSFGAYYTAIIISILNAFLLNIRISVEEKALAEVSDYPTNMKNRHRFIPQR